MNDADENITLRQAYLAMFAYFEEISSRSNSDELAGALGSMSLLKDGSTADPAAWHDWLRCIRKAREGKVDALLQIKQG